MRAQHMGLREDMAIRRKLLESLMDEAGRDAPEIDGEVLSELDAAPANSSCSGPVCPRSFHTALRRRFGSVI